MDVYNGVFSTLSTPAFLHVAINTFIYRAINVHLTTHTIYHYCRYHELVHRHEISISKLTTNLSPFMFFLFFIIISFITDKTFTGLHN